MRLSFVKMHAAGNDYIYIDGVRRRPPHVDWSILARLLSDRHRGVGADGLILILPSENNQFRMRIFNADGSEGDMCGNGIRCLGGYVWDHGLIDSPSFMVDTLDGPVELNVSRQPDQIYVQAKMPPPKFRFSDIPMQGYGSTIAEKIMLDIKGHSIPIYGARVGNPNCVLFVRDVDAIDAETLGPLLEKHPIFPEGANVEFTTCVSEDLLRVKVWERGSGITQSCGTGACAAAAWAIRSGRSNSPVKVRMPGGDLFVEWEPDGPISLDGAVIEVYRGTVKVPKVARLRSDITDERID